MTVAARRFVGRSKNRRWWSTEGAEWAALRMVEGVAQAGHVARLNGNGARGRRTLRSTVQRAARPRACC
eukprot:14360099-Alexandrium_andersonii.AAC.1